MAKIKVHELAKEIDMQSKDVISILAELGIEGKTASSGLEDDQADAVRKKIKGGKSAPAKETPEAAPAKEAPAAAPVKSAPAKEEASAKPAVAPAAGKPADAKQVKPAAPANGQAPIKKKKPLIYVAGSGNNNARTTTNNTNQARPNPGAGRPNSPSGRPTGGIIRPTVPTTAARYAREAEQHPRTIGGKPDAAVNTTPKVDKEVQAQVQDTNPVSGSNPVSAENITRTVEKQQTAPAREQRGDQQGFRDGQNRNQGSRDHGSRNQGGREQSGRDQGGRDSFVRNQGGRDNRPAGNRDRNDRNDRNDRGDRNQGNGNRGDRPNMRPSDKSNQNRNAAFTGDAGPSSKEGEKGRKEERRKGQDKNKKDMTYAVEDGFRGGKPVKGAKVAKLERPTQVKKEEPEEEKIKVITLPENITIKDLADKMKVPSASIIKKLFMQGKVVTVNQEVSFEQAEEIAMEFEILCEKEVVVDVIAELTKDTEDPEETLTSRPPVICVMGHVDHGKTSLLDAIRKTRVIDKEAGGITQHIGAYVVDINDRKITFLDTPGHEAFTAMRMRGANSTDIAILVVAADDGVMPQTVEAINHAKAAGIEIIVAVNKIDKPSANIDRVKQELAEYGLACEEWGGSTVYVPVSAKTGEGIENLLEMILLTSDILELKANANRKARGLIIEAQLDKGRGPVATVLVQKGTLHVGDFIAVGSCHGKVRAMVDDTGHRVKVAGPSTPVEIMGLNDVPGAGEIFMAMDSDKEAKNFADTFIAHNKVKLLDDTKMKMSLDDLFQQIQAGNLKELNLIIKADVQGSVEAVKESLLKLSNDEVVVKVIHGGVGAINESDVILASASNAIIIGFNVRPDATAKTTAEREGVDLRLYDVIYKAIEDVEAAMKGMLDPIFEEKIIGHAEIRQIFKASAVGMIAGSYVLDGSITRNCQVRITHEGTQIYEGKLASLKRFADDAKEVKSGFECGLVFDDFKDFSELDIVEAYVMVEVPRT